VAELALTLMLVCLRRVKELDARIRAGEIVPSIRALGTGLHRRTVGLIGMGATAYELAKLLVPFECRILVWSPTSPPERWSGVDPRFPAPIDHHRTVELREMLEQVDVVSLHCPITPVTRGLIGEAELRAMKPTAILINTARGGIVDENALALALKENRLGGAGLDVFAVEPAHGVTMGELGKMDNVVCLPHM
jgi:D-3-phosphoglycerate dehydrogenase